MRLPPRHVLLPDKRREADDATAAVKPPVRVSTVTARTSANSRRVLLPDKRKGPHDATAAIEQPVRAATVTARNSTTSRQFKNGTSEGAEPSPSNQLLAGYLANEFLTERTLFGEPCESPRAQALPAPAPIFKPRKRISTPFAWKPEPSGRAADSKRRRYLEVSILFRADGFQMPGIVNPAQLARFLKVETIKDSNVNRDPRPRG